MKRVLLYLFITVWQLSIVNAQQKPTLKGGVQAFAQSKLVYPPFAKDNCIQGTVELAFKLDLKGKINYNTVSKGVGADLDKEAIRLLQLSSGKWLVPAGYDTTALVHAPITFNLEDFGCQPTNGTSQALAISRFRDQQKTLHVITNYYQEINLGKKMSISLAEVEGLKKQIGIDDSYVDRLVTIAERKLKLGDKKGACDDFMLIKNLGSAKGQNLLNKYCK
jgi:TonB family protein